MHESPGHSLSHTQNDQRTEPVVVVAIVNYCTPELVINCLASLSAFLKESPSVAVVVVDNASPDGSGKQIADVILKNGWNDWARLAAMPRNGGFAYGNNAVIREYLNSATSVKYFWLLNSDTVIREGALSILVDFMDCHPEVGIAGSRLEDPDGTPQHSAFRFHSITTEFESSISIGIVSRLLNRWKIAPPIAHTNKHYDWLSGASMLIRTEVFQQIGLLDESYFLYYEETDFCMRASKRDWQCWYIPESRVVHLVGHSTEVTKRTGITRRRAPYWFESRRRYYVKHYGRFYASMADLALAAGTLIRMVRDSIQRRPSSYPEKFLYDLAHHSAALNPSNVSTPR